MTRSILAAIAVFSVVGCEGGKDSAIPAGDATAGEAVFTSACTSCHGSDGSGGSGPSLYDEVPEKSDADLQDIVLNGYDDMPAIALDDTEYGDLLAYMRDTFGEYGG